MGFSKRFKFWKNKTYFTSCTMKKHYFLLWAKETAFFPYIYQWNYSLQRWAICLRSQLWILLEHHIFKHRHKSNIKGGIFELRSSNLFRDQRCKDVLDIKCQACNFTGVLSFTGVCENFGPIFLTSILQN